MSVRETLSSLWSDLGAALVLLLIVVGCLIVVALPFAALTAVVYLVSVGWHGGAP